MNQFDHAIVHVPAGGDGKPELWIDATAEFTRVGDLPYMDQGRLALIIADGTSTLTRTPDPKPADSVLIETREVTLQPFGPARIVETSATTGQIDSDYRARYGATLTKATRDDLEQYCKNAYAAKALTKIEHSEGDDLTKPFSLRLEMASASRGITTISDAAVAVAPAAALAGLPSWFSTDPDKDNSKLTPEQQADRKKAEQQRVPEYLVRPFITERRYRVIVPEGFVPRALPDDQTVQLGPATLTRHFAVEQGGQSPTVVTAVYRFDTVKQRYSADEVLALRKAVLEAYRQDYVVLQFDQAGAKLLADGKIREALSADRGLIAAHPSEAIQHVHMSAAFLSAGLGEQAQNEARAATRSIPNRGSRSSNWPRRWSTTTLACIWARALIAMALSPPTSRPSNSSRMTRPRGLILPYSMSTARRATATPTVPILPTPSRNTANSRTSTKISRRSTRTIYSTRCFTIASLLTFWPTRYAQSHSARDAIGITAVAASQSVSAAVQRANLISGDNQKKSAALGFSGLQLIRIGLYAQASEVLSAGIQGQSDAAQMARQIDVFRTLQHASSAPLSPTDPRAPIELMLTSTMDGTVAQQAAFFLARHAYATNAEWKKVIESNAAAGSIIRVVAQRAQLPTAVMRDVTLGNAKIAVTATTPTATAPPSHPWARRTRTSLSPATTASSELWRRAPTQQRWATTHSISCATIAKPRRAACWTGSATLFIAEAATIRSKAISLRVSGTRVLRAPVTPGPMPSRLPPSL